MVCKPPLAAHRHAHQRKWWEWRGRAVAHLTYLLAAATCLDAAVASLSAAIHGMLRCAALCCAVLPAVDSMGPSMEFLKLGSFDALYRHFPPLPARHHTRAQGERRAPLCGGEEGQLQAAACTTPAVLAAASCRAGQGQGQAGCCRQAAAERLMREGTCHLMPSTCTAAELHGEVHPGRAAGRRGQPAAAPHHRAPGGGAQGGGHLTTRCSPWQEACMRQPALPETHPPCNMQFCVPPCLFPPSLPACSASWVRRISRGTGRCRGSSAPSSGVCCASCTSMWRRWEVRGTVGNGGTVEWAGWVGSWRGRCRGHLMGRLSSAHDKAALEAKVCSPLSAAALSCPARLTCRARSRLGVQEATSWSQDDEAARHADPAAPGGLQ